MFSPFATPGYDALDFPFAWPYSTLLVIYATGVPWRSSI